MGEPGTELPTFGSSFVLSLLSLAIVCLFAYVALRWLGRRGGGGRFDSAMRVRGRCFLEPRRSLYIVEAAGRCFLIGVGDGPLNLIAEIDPAALGTTDAPSESGFADVLARVLRRRSR